MQDITEWTNLSITQNLSRVAGHPIVQVDDYFYSQIFSLCCYLDHFPPLSPFIASHNKFPSSVLSYHWVEINTWISQFISYCPSGIFTGKERGGGSQESEKTKPLCNHYCNFLKFPSHKVIPKPFLCYLKTLTLRTSFLSGECGISLHDHDLPACLCFKYKSFSLHILYSHEVETKHGNLIKHLIMFQKAF